jgi:hypothetical protein
MDITGGADLDLDEANPDALANPEEHWHRTHASAGEGNPSGRDRNP